MSAGARVAVFAALLAAVFAAAALAGQALDPGTASSPHGGHAAGAPAPAHAQAPAGLDAEQDGLTLVPGATQFRAGDTGRFAFRIVDGRGATVRAFDREQAKRMHLIVVRRDLTGFAHLHPVQRASGAWSVALRLPAAGAYRAYADFSTGGRRGTLSTGLLAPGAFAPRPLPAARPVARVDGYDVVLRGPATFTVSRGGAPVADLQPYLGARGHLVVLRASDLAYEHVHPLAARGGAPGQIAFSSAGSAPGSYRLFLQFRHRGRVHVAPFTRRISSP